MSPAEQVTQLHLDPSTLIAAVRNVVRDHPSVVVHVSDGETGRVLGIYRTPTGNAWSPTPARRVNAAMAPVFQMAPPAATGAASDPDDDELDDEDGPTVARAISRNLAGAFGHLLPLSARTRQQTYGFGRGPQAALT